MKIICNIFLLSAFALLINIQSIKLYTQEYINPTSVVYNQRDNTMYISTAGTNIGHTTSHFSGINSSFQNIKGKIYSVKDSVMNYFAYGDESNFKLELDNNNLYVCGIDYISIIPLNKSRKKDIRVNQKRNNRRYEKDSIQNIISFCVYKNNKLLILEKNNYLFEYNTSSNQKTKLAKLDSIYRLTDIAYIKNGKKIVVTSTNFNKPILILNEEYEFEEFNIDLKVPLKSIVEYNDNEVLVNSPSYGKIYKISLTNGRYETISSNLYNSGFISYDNNKLYVPMTKEGTIKIIEVE